MTKNDFNFMIATKKAFEFEYNGKRYNITYGSDEKGEYISFGLLFQGQKYYSIGELLNEARIENHYFKEMIEDL